MIENYADLLKSTGSYEVFCKDYQFNAGAELAYDTEAQRDFNSELGSEARAFHQEENKWDDIIEREILLEEYEESYAMALIYDL